MTTNQQQPPTQRIQRNKSTIISRPEMKEALKRSGYLIEYRVAQILQEYRYHSDANSAYLDPVSNKTRELDVYAITATMITPKRIDSPEFFWTVLVVECVNNLQPLAFFSREPAAEFLNLDAVTLAGCPKRILQRKNAIHTPLSEYLELENYHHYCKGLIATQYCSSIKRRIRTKTIGWRGTTKSTTAR